MSYRPDICEACRNGECGSEYLDPHDPADMPITIRKELCIETWGLENLLNDMVRRIERLENGMGND